MMAQSTAPPPFFFLFSRSTKPSPLPTSFSRSSLPFPSLRSSNANANANARRRDRGGDAFAYGGDYQKLEEEIFEFMRCSKKPDAFPTKNELIEAGRRDLAQAVAARGGWLAFGWDLNKERGRQEENSGSDSGIVREDGALREEAEVRENHRGGHPDYPEVSVSGRTMDEEENSDNIGLEGILKRIEKQRSLAKDKKGHGQLSDSKRELDPGEVASFNHKHPIEISKMSNKPNFSPLQEELLHEYHMGRSKNGRSSISNGSVNSVTSDTRLSLGNDNSASSSEAVKIVLTEERTALESNTLKDDFSNGRLHYSAGLNGSRGSGKKPSHEVGEMRQRIQDLESSLSSTLDTVRSRVKKVLSNEIDGSSAAKLGNLSDDWEFRETDILKAKDEVRSLRAKLSVLEGKMALQIIEAQKLMEENQKRLDEARRALCGLRNISVVWPNPASEVLLAGSFDGWTSKRRMEKSREGIFSLNLMLYPGKYEIKFIVDGVWTVDPLRPVVHQSGHENNLLTVV
ncbi:5'-AMP-activated protein kinase-like protein [Rhynchospora pubera]|uniref:5'-AMP-activated protein kinase-like protein n=1 Tax=Rhynchospora pubera TaxID=906938 RepID=A0AAV8DK27_9POAL|nr:5'-AMP-activated protein kinase-like protein [Rhynchospora pubera]